MGKKLLVLHGPNLNLLGEREGRSGGRLEDLDRALREKAAELGVELKVVQSNHEGVLVDTLHAERHGLAGIAINPAGLFGSHVLREALELVGVPAIEVTLGEPRDDSLVGEVCELQLSGDDFDPYLDALVRLAEGDFEVGEDEEEEEEEDDDVVRPARQELGGRKTLGRRAEPAPASPDKTLGRRVVESALAPKPPQTALSAPARALARTVDAVKTLGRGRPEAAPAPAEKPGKTLGRVARETPASNVLSRDVVREKIADRLAGRLTPAELATWARARWQEVQRGAPAESGHRELLEDSLQRLTLSTMAATKMTDDQLVDLMTRLDR